MDIINVIQKFKIQFLNLLNLQEKYFFEEDYIASIQDRIDDLNDEMLLDNKFCLTFNQLIDEYCYPLSKIEVENPNI